MSLCNREINFFQNLLENYIISNAPGAAALPITDARTYFLAVTLSILYQQLKSWRKAPINLSKYQSKISRQTRNH